MHGCVCYLYECENTDVFNGLEKIVRDFVIEEIVDDRRRAN